MSKPCRPVEERFWEKVTRAGPDECWDWQERGRDQDGYGIIRLSPADGSRNARGHQASWLIHNGSIPEGLQVLHHCDRPPCVNPAHLWLGTNDDNMRDKKEKGRGRGGMVRLRGEDHPSAKLTWPEVREIRRRYADGGITQQALADEYGVSQPVIGAIVRGRIWLE